MSDIQKQIDTQQAKLAALKEQRKEINRRIKRAEKEIEDLKNRQILAEVDLMRGAGYSSEQIRDTLHHFVERETDATDSAPTETIGDEIDGER